MHDVHRRLHPLYVWSYTVTLGLTCKVEEEAVEKEAQHAVAELHVVQIVPK